MSITIVAVNGYEQITGLTSISVTTARFELNIIASEKATLRDQFFQTHATGAFERWLHVLGLLAYGTYEFTNYATLRDWSVNQVVVDTLWGGVLTGFSAWIGVVATRAVFPS